MICAYHSARSLRFTPKDSFKHPLNPFHSLLAALGRTTKRRSPLAGEQAIVQRLFARKRAPTGSLGWGGNPSVGQARSVVVVVGPNERLCVLVRLGNSMFFFEPFAQIDQLAAFAAEWTEAGVGGPGHVFTTLGTRGYTGGHSGISLDIRSGRFG